MGERVKKYRIPRSVPGLRSENLTGRQPSFCSHHKAALNHVEE
jgi:hypothetical protein